MPLIILTILAGAWLRGGNIIFEFGLAVKMNGTLVLGKKRRLGCPLVPGNGGSEHLAAQTLNERGDLRSKNSIIIISICRVCVLS